MNGRPPDGYWTWKRCVFWLAALAASYWFFGPTFLLGLRPAPGSRPVDFFQEWASARNWYAGRPIYSDLGEAARQYLGYEKQPDDPLFVTVNAHPPTAVLLTLPLGGLNYPDAVLAWNLLSLAALAVSLWLTARALRVRLSAWSLVPAVALLLPCNPLIQQTYQAQLNLVLLLLLTGVWAADRSGRPRLAGALLGAATAIKLLPCFLFLVFVLRREWRPVISGLASLAACVAATAAVLGPGAFYGFFAAGLPAVNEWRGSLGNASLPGLWWKVFDPGPKGLHAPFPPESPWLARLGAAVCCAALVGLAARRVWRGRTPADRDWSFGLAVLTMVVVSPVAWSHYFLLLLPPAALLWARLPAGGLARPAFYALLIPLWISQKWIFRLALGGEADQPAVTLFQVVTLGSLHLYALLGLFALTRWASLRGREEVHGAVGGKRRRRGEGSAASPGAAAPLLGP